MRTALALLLGLTATSAQAHGLDVGQLIIRLAGDTLYVQTTPPASVFAAFDDNKDGLIERAELKKHRKAMLATFSQGLVFTNHAGQTGELFFSDLSLPHGHGDTAGRPHLRATLRWRWSAPPEWLELAYAHAKDAPMNVRAQQATGAVKLTQQRMIGKPVQAKLDATAHRLRLFAPN